MTRITIVALALAAAVVASATPSHAVYTECIVQKDTAAVSRPGGRTMPRWTPLERGEKVATMDVYRDWVFVLHFVNDDREEYGWVPRSVLRGCQAKEGTP
jgi:hypothetical protein